MKEQEIIMYDTPDLVEYRTNIEGWVGKNGKFYGKGEGAEHLARYDNATHNKCSCGEIKYVYSSKCNSCKEITSEEAYLKLEIGEWDESCPVVERGGDNFFYSMEDIEWYCGNNDVEVSELQLVLCEKSTRIFQIDIDELNDEYIHHDGDKGVSHYHPDIAKKVEELNELIRNTEPELWFETNKRVVLSTV